MPKARRSKNYWPNKPVVKAKPGNAMSGVKFQASGKRIGVKIRGKHTIGVHQALNDCLNPDFNFEALEKSGRLVNMPMPLPSMFIKADSSRTNTASTMQEHQRMYGSLLDAQLGKTVKMHATLGVPVECFINKEMRNKFAKESLTVEQSKELHGICATMMPEAHSAWRAFIKLRLNPISTQNPVARGKVGTCVDVVVVDSNGAIRVIEIKRGCTHSYGSGKMFLAPYGGRKVSTHDHYVLQTLVNSRLYQSNLAKDTPLVMAEPLLIRLDKDGAHIYKMPQWAIDGLDELMRRIC